MFSSRLLACASLIALLLCGCGQTGPLVYPGDQNTPSRSDNQTTTE